MRQRTMGVIVPCSTSTMHWLQALFFTPSCFPYVLVSEDFLFEGAYRLKIHMSKRVLSLLLPHNPLAEMSRLASSSLFAVGPDSISPLSGYKVETTPMSWHTSDIMQAVKSLTSLCSIMGKPPFWNESAWSTEKEVPHEQSVRIRVGVNHSTN